MRRTGRWKLMAAVAVLIGGLTIGAVQSPFSSESANANAEDQACLDPVKIFKFVPTKAERANVSALMTRLSADIPPERMRYAPEPTEILRHSDGRLELRYEEMTMRHADALEISICGASPSHEIKEATWIVRERGKRRAQMVDEERISWSWRENGEQTVPDTERESKALSCPGEPLVHRNQEVARNEPLCVKDPDKLSTIQAKIDQIQAESTSWKGAAKKLIMGEDVYRKRLETLNKRMDKLYVYSPYDGTVTNIRRDDMNDLVWIEMAVESRSGEALAEP